MSVLVRKDKVDYRIMTPAHRRSIKICNKCYSENIEYSAPFGSDSIYECKDCGWLSTKTGI